MNLLLVREGDLTNFHKVFHIISRMLTLQSIPDLPSEAVDLLEAVGYLEAREFCAAENASLLEEILKANEALGIVSDPPQLADIEEWKALVLSALDEHSASEEVDFKETESTRENKVEPLDLSEPVTSDQSENLQPEVSLISFENVLEMDALLKKAPVAELVPVQLIREHQIAVGDIAEGILLSDCPEDLVFKVSRSERLASPKPSKQKVFKSSLPDPLPATQPKAEISKKKRADLMTSRIRDFSQAQTEDHHVKPLDRGKPREIITLSKGVNEGLTPEDRRFVRGVLHSDPGQVKVSAFFAVLAQVCLVATLIVVPGLIIYDIVYGFANLFGWVLGILLVSLFSGIAYLIFSLKARCCVCRQQQFVPKKCMKHRKAHHIPLIGYIFPTALQVMFYSWFYCIYCGTAVRLKK